MSKRHLLREPSIGMAMMRDIIVQSRKTERFGTAFFQGILPIGISSTAIVTNKLQKIIRLPYVRWRHRYPTSPTRYRSDRSGSLASAGPTTGEGGSADPNCPGQAQQVLLLSWTRERFISTAKTCAVLASIMEPRSPSI